MSKTKAVFPITRRPEGDCMFPDCTRSALVRGLCNSHYGMAATYVSKGLTTWSDLVARGKCLPTKTRKGAKSWFIGEDKKQ